jgi:hypothetical protein
MPKAKQTPETQQEQQGETRKPWAEVRPTAPESIVKAKTERGRRVPARLGSKKSPAPQRFGEKIEILVPVAGDTAEDTWRNILTFFTSHVAVADHVAAVVRQASLDRAKPLMEYEEATREDLLTAADATVLGEFTRGKGGSSATELAAERAKNAELIRSTEELIQKLVGAGIWSEEEGEAHRQKMLGLRTA